jgi:Mrp family chromosome partitioning ATPase
MNRDEPVRPAQRPNATLSAVPGGADNWVVPRSSGGVEPYIRAVLARWWLIVLMLMLTIGAAVFYLERAQTTYTAEADLLVTPIHSTDSTLVGLGLLQASGDATRDADTAARLVRSPDVARDVQSLLDVNRSISSLLSSVSTKPASQANIVAIQATATTPDMARRIADAFAQATVSSRTARMHSVIAQLLPQVRASVRGLPAGDPQAELLADLQLLRAAPDPTLQVAAAAQMPTSPSSPRPLFSLAAAIFAGLVLGVGGALALAAVDPRLRGEESLRQRYRLPVLARISARAMSAARIAFDGAGRAASVPHESFRALMAAITTSSSNNPRSRARTVLVGGASGNDGATETAINLALALAGAGHRVLLIDASMLQPAIGPVLGQASEKGLENVIAGEVALGEVLIPGMPRVQLLLPARRPPPYARDMLSPEQVRDILSAAAPAADWIVIYAPPVSLSSDGLPFAIVADKVLIVVRLNQTRLDDLGRLTDTYIQHGIRPVGFAVVGAR